MIRDHNKHERVEFLDLPRHSLIPDGVDVVSVVAEKFDYRVIEMPLCLKTVEKAPKLWIHHLVAQLPCKIVAVNNPQTEIFSLCRVKVEKLLHELDAEAEGVLPLEAVEMGRVGAPAKSEGVGVCEGQI